MQGIVCLALLVATAAVWYFVLASPGVAVGTLAMAAYIGFLAIRNSSNA